tara:strand:+ start:238 stop:687 length:450 start_codon:yes stop_codon:yes gene_type:complete
MGFLINTYTKSSNIQNAGIGRFFAEDGKKGDTVRVQNIQDDLFIYRNIEELKTCNYPYKFGHSKPNISNDNMVYFNKEPLYTNHSKFNNVAFKFTDDTKITYLIRDVKKDDEMLQDYTSYSKIEWYEDYLNSINEQSLRQFALSMSKTI